MIQEDFKEDNREENKYEEIDEDDNSVKIFDTDLNLPVKTFFNSNLLLLDDYLIMIDGYNNAIEFNLKSISHAIVKSSL